ncbi:peptidoglycan DD-metalloendopeptidase family protein [Melioribacteraceae bacterium 4301-Me]|uniref:peptidoglycan DD-metalloendopeptidase family protein n=1 Tax=Pyranulibacter aquaticus TaxID=3163344 RepID=UPI00359918C1
MNLREIKKAAVYVTPNFSSLTTKRYKVSLLRLFAYLVVYSLLVMFIFFMILFLTPLKNTLYMFDSSQLKTEKARIEELEKQITFLTRQLESMASENQKLKYAIMLGKADTLDSTSAIYDSLRSYHNQKLKIGGNLYEAFITLMNKIFHSTNLDSQEVFLNPATGIIIQYFDPDKGHFGIDYGLKIGTPIYASIGGLIIFADYLTTDGYVIMIQHKNGYITIYKHCSLLLKRTREFVNQGELIALSGNSGSNTTGPHLHFEIWKDGKPIDPLSVITK